MALCMRWHMVWSSTTICMRNLWQLPTGKGVPLGCHWLVCGSDNRGVLQGKLSKTTCIQKRTILPLFLYLSHIFCLLQNTSLDESIIVILEYTSSNCVKLLDHLSDPQSPHQPDIFEDFLRHMSDQSIAVLSASMCMGSLFVFLPLQEGKATQT